MKIYIDVTYRHRGDNTYVVITLFYYILLSTGKQQCHMINDISSVNTFRFACSPGGVYNIGQVIQGQVRGWGYLVCRLVLFL